MLLNSKPKIRAGKKKGEKSSSLVHRLRVGEVIVQVLLTWKPFTDEDCRLPVPVSRY